MHFDHIGVIVPDLRQARLYLSKLFLIPDWTVEFEDPVNKVLVQFGRDPSGVCYEAIAPLGADSPVSRTLLSGGRILNHVAYLVPDIAKSAEQFRSWECVPSGKATPAVAYGGNLVQFFVSPLRFMIELIEAPEHKHRYFSVIDSGYSSTESGMNDEWRSWPEKS
jgi:methylmalonyl-CoA/ethylmalonyl-CoA epimerase